MYSSINLVDFVTGRAKVTRGEISTEVWCEILQEVLWQIKPSLKYLDGFKPLAQLLDGKEEFMSGHGRFGMSDDVVPSFKGMGFDERTKFFPLALWQYPKQEASCEEKCGALLLALGENEGSLAILNLSRFRQGDHYAVCACSLVTTTSVQGITSVLEPNGKEVSGLIDKGFVYVSCILDRLYLAFYSTVDKREKYLVSMRASCDWLQRAYQRCSG